jgi:ribosomal protein S18 acetylase RimI-like enzyme
MHDVAPLDLSNAGTAAGTFARAFFDDPLFAYIQPDEGKRKRVVGAQIRLMVNIGLRCGVSDATPDAKGVVVWMPPGQEPSPMDMLRAGALSVPFRSGFSPFVRFMGAMNESDKAHAQAIEGHHWYLVGAAVDPELHGRGVGTAVIEHGLARVDGDGSPAYLETSRERNVPYWQRFGFDVAFTDRLGKDSVQYWGMVRPARS